MKRKNDSEEPVKRKRPSRRRKSKEKWRCLERLKNTINENGYQYDICTTLHDHFKDRTFILKALTINPKYFIMLDLPIPYTLSKKRLLEMIKIDPRILLALWKTRNAYWTHLYELDFMKQVVQIHPNVLVDPKMIQADNYNSRGYKSVLYDRRVQLAGKWDAERITQWRDIRFWFFK